MTAATWLSQPPFTGQINHDEQIALLTQEAVSGSADFEGAVTSYRSAPLAPADLSNPKMFGPVLQIDLAPASVEISES